MYIYIYIERETNLISLACARTEERERNHLIFGAKDMPLKLVDIQPLWAHEISD
jgi:hypothetical protein